VFACDLFEICVYQVKGFFGVVGWFDVVLRSEYAAFLEAFVGNGLLVCGGKTCEWFK